MPKITCPRCRAENIAGETFCVKCGVRLVTAQTAPAAAAPVVMAAPAAKATPSMQPATSLAKLAGAATKDRRPLYLVIVACLVVASVVAVYLMTRTGGAQPSSAGAAGADICASILPMGESHYDSTTGMTFTSMGQVQQGNKNVCKFSVTGGAADECGDLTVFIDVYGAIAAGEGAQAKEFTSCQMKYKTPDCFELCANMVYGLV